MSCHCSDWLQVQLWYEIDSQGLGWRAVISQRCLLWAQRLHWGKEHQLKCPCAAGGERKTENWLEHPSEFGKCWLESCDTRLLDCIVSFCVWKWCEAGTHAGIGTHSKCCPWRRKVARVAEWKCLFSKGYFRRGFAEETPRSSKNSTCMLYGCLQALISKERGAQASLQPGNELAFHLRKRSGSHQAIYSMANKQPLGFISIMCPTPDPLYCSSQQVVGERPTAPEEL